MEFAIKGKTFKIWSGKRIVYTICFFLFCLIDQRTKTGSGLDGIIETFRNMAGVLMAVIIMTHYKWEDFKAHKIPYAIWTAVGAIVGILYVIYGQPLAYFMNERIMAGLDVLLFGYVVIHTFISVVIEKNYPRLNKGLFGLWTVMMLLMIFSRSDYVWPFCYFIMFGCFYLTDFTEEEQDDLYQGIMNGVILAFFAFQGYCCVFRPYDQDRYAGIYNNPNLNGLFYLVVLAAVFGKILYVTRENKHKFWKVYYWLGAGAVYSCMLLTISRTTWIAAFALGLFFIVGYCVMQKKGLLLFLKKGILLTLCVLSMFPIVFGLVRYVPPVFHHPVWFWGEWSERRVHSWDPWDSEKYMNIDDWIHMAIYRTQQIANGVVSRSGLVLKAYAAEDKTYEQAVFKDAQENHSPLLIRKTIYRNYIKNLNVLGHTQKDQGFQLTPYQWVGHAHNIYLQYATDFGIIYGILFIIWNLCNIVILGKEYCRKIDIKKYSYLLAILVPLLFGILEYSWGSGSLTIILLYISWREAMTAPRNI